MRKLIQSVIFIVRLIVAIIEDYFTEKYVEKAYAGRISTTELVNRIYNFCEVYSGRVMYPYQGQFSKRIIRSVLENDGAELTALFSRQSGKCFEKGTEILMSDGTVKKVEDIVVGDYVMSPNSKPVRVTALGRGREDMFEVRSREKNHESFVVNKSHILSLVDRKGNIVNMSVEDYLKEPEWKKKDYYRGYRVAVEYPHKEVGIEPYFLGLWLGDGSSHDVKITNIDQEVIDYLHDYAERLGMQVSVYKEEGKINDYAITNTNHNKHKRFHYNPIREFLKKNNLFGNKHIPQKCLSNSREFRLELLAGLIDSDGYRSEQKGKENVMTISLSNKRLADDVLRLIRSLGFRASMKTKTTKLNGKEFVCYPISAYGDFTEVPTKIPRKQWKTCNLRENPLTFGFDLIPKGVDDYYGFTIDSEDHLFLLGDYTVTHNTETVAITVGGLMIILPQLANMPMFLDDPRLQMFKDGFWVGIFAPSQRQAQTTYNRMKGRMQCKEAQAVLQDPDFRLEFTTSNGQTVALSNGSFCTAISASDGSNIEGESFKFIICEECQDISNYKIRKCLTGDTRVLLDDGSYERIDTIVEQGNKGKEFNVVCFDSTMSWKTTKVPLEYYDNGVQDVYEIALDNGSTIKATLNHQFYTLNKKTRGTKCKFRTVQEILDSMDKDRPLRIGVPERLPYFAESKSLDYEKGLIIGYMMGDGCMVGTPKFIGDIPTCERLHELIQLVVGNEVNMTECNYNKNNGMCEVCFSTPTNKKGSNTFVSFLKDFGVYGLVKDKKCLPDKVYSREFYRGYIEGLIETDGSVENCHVKPIISFANVSEKMVDQLKDIYLKFGIHATKFVRDNSKGLGGDNALPLYLLHIKSVKDIRNFVDNIVLFRKQVFLNDSLDAIEDKLSREESKYYPEEMRFCKVKSIKYVGREHTYCLKVEGRNFIANNMISSNSIHPMGAAYNATICKIGTATTFKGDFYEAIQRNKKEYEEGKLRIRNHFEYNYKVVMKYNPKYAKYVEREKRSLGETSDEFRMSYCVTPETRILTSDLRWVRADSIKAGDKLIGFDENPPKRYGQRKFNETLVEDVGEIERPCYEVTLNNGTKVTCSEEHQWLVFTAGSRTVWKQTKDLVSTDRIYKVCDVWEDLPQDYRLGYLSASFDGEGCITQVNGKIQQLTFAQRDNAMLKQVKEYLTDFGFDYNADYYDKRKEAKGQDLVYKLFIKGGKRELLRFLGSVRPKRLLENFDPNQLGTVRCSNGDLGSDIHPRVESIKYVGVKKVIPIRTTSHTYVAEGLASHNCLEWIISRGMFVDIEKVEKECGDEYLDRVTQDHVANHVAGIDVGGGSAKNRKEADSTVITIVEVDWNNPVLMESTIDEETGEDIVYLAYNTYIKDWLEISPEVAENYEEQYHIIMDYLKNFRISRIVIDATRESSLGQRIQANSRCEVVLFTFSSKSKSDIYKHLQTEINTGRARFPMSQSVKETKEYQKFSSQLADLQKSYSGSYLVVSHPDERGAHDDYPDSWALAVWGTKDVGEVDNTETQSRSKVLSVHKNGSSVFHSRNRVTARRR